METHIIIEKTNKHIGFEKTFYATLLLIIIVFCSNKPVDKEELKQKTFVFALNEVKPVQGFLLGDEHYYKKQVLFYSMDGFGFNIHKFDDVLNDTIWMAKNTRIEFFQVDTNTIYDLQKIENNNDSIQKVKCEDICNKWRVSDPVYYQGYYYVLVSADLLIDKGEFEYGGKVLCKYNMAGDLINFKLQEYVY